MTEQNILRYGSSDPLPETTPLRAGPLTLEYEAGDLRYVKLGDEEIIRRIYVAVRDHNWDTIPATLSDVEMNVGDDSFEISYTARHAQGDIDFEWFATITGNADGKINFAMDGEALSSFQRNRIGFCLLHPASCAGATCRVEHVDGTETEGAFPQTISPHQPFFDMRSIAHQLGSGAWAEVRFDGDIFEMEDQRNWTDASYKTYCTPLALPFPVEVKQGSKVEQSIQLKLTGDVFTAPNIASDGESASAQIDVGSEPIGRLPRLGLGVAAHGARLTAQEVERLRQLNLAHLRVDLHLSKKDVRERLHQATEEATAIGAALHAALFVTDNAEEELMEFASLLHEIQPPISVWLIFHEGESTTDAQWIAAARSILGSYHAYIPFISGTNAYFTELNRERPAVDVIGSACYSLNPQVHAFDNRSLVETLEAQATTVESARTFLSDWPICISPVTLRPRFNPNATGPEPEPAAGELPSQVDPRQMSLFGAAWTLGSLQHLCQAAEPYDLWSITYYETTGWRGVMERESGSPLPVKFPSTAGAVFPLWFVLATVGAFADGEVLPVTVSDPLKVAGLALQKGDERSLLVANLTAEALTISLDGVGIESLEWILDTNTISEAIESPLAFLSGSGQAVSMTEKTLTLDAYGVAKVR